MAAPYRRRPVIIAGIVLVCLLLVAIAESGAIARAALDTLASRATGTNVSVGSAQIGLGGSTLSNISVRSKSGEPIATIGTLAVAYSLPDWLTGKRMFGLERIDIAHPDLTVIRHRDGSFNLPAPSRQPSGGPSAPWRISGSVVDGNVTLIDQSGARPASSRVRDLNVSFAFDPTARITYDAKLTYVERNRPYRITGAGDIDRGAGHSLQRWQIPAMPIAMLLNFAMPAGVRVQSGEISGADPLIFGFRAPNGNLQTAISATTFIRNLGIAVRGLRVPIRDLSARLDVSSAAATFTGLRGSLAGVPLSGEGGVYDLTHPALHLAIAANGDVAQLRTVVDGAQGLPAHGRVAIRILAEGPATAPFAMISVRAPALTYAPVRVQNSSLLAAFHDGEIDILGAHAEYGSITADAQGRIALQQRRSALEVLAHLHAPARAVPYSSMFFRAPIDATALATSADLKLVDAYGALWGSDRDRSLAGTFSVTSAGVGTIGPLIVNGRQGTLYAQAFLDRPHNVNSAFFDADDLALPALGGSVSGNGVLLNEGRRALAQIDGMRFSGVRVAGIPLQRADATLAFAPNDARVLAADVGTARSDILASGTLNRRRTALSADAISLLNGSVSIAALAGGTLSRPTLRSTIVARNLRYRNATLDGMSSLSYRDGTLTLANTSLGAQGTYVNLDGTVSGIAFGEPIVPRYDVNASTRAADLAPLLAVANPSAARLENANLNANVHVGGSGMNPAIRGSIDVPEGSVNGLAFRDMHADISGSRASLAVRDGSAIFGSTRVAFDGTARMSPAIDVHVSAARADLADFDDFFDEGDVLSGRGSLDAVVAYAPGRLTSSGTIALADARFRQFAVGTVDARWSQSGAGIALQARADGEIGRLTASGTVDPAARSGDVVASAQHLDLATFLPMLGVVEPVQGFVDGQVRVNGRFPDVDTSLNATMSDGLIGRTPITRASVSLHTSGGRGRLDAATLQVPYLLATASGGFGLSPNDALALDIHAASPDVGKLAQTVTGSAYGISGTLDTNGTIAGTLASPQIRDTSTLAALRYQQLYVPNVTTNVALSSHAFHVDTLATLQRGTVSFTADAPLRTMFAVPRDPSMQASLAANDVEVSNIAALLPKGTKAQGRIDGTVRADGTLTNPQFSGALNANDLSYSGPLERSPITARAELAFLGRTFALRNTSADVGGGTVTLSGQATLPDLLDVGAASFDLGATASNVRLDAPQYYTGDVNGNLSIVQQPNQTPTIGGTMTFSSARVPLTAFLNSGGSTASKGPPIDFAFNKLQIDAGNDVRVQSPNVDLGATGSLTLNGTLAALHPSGTFRSTGGTVSFYRTFVVDRGTVAFDPSEGIIPRVDAVATTYVTNPNTMIRMHVTGPATMLNLGLQSDPAYDRSQILGLLVGAQQFGAVQGVTSSGGPSATPTSLISGMAAGQVNQVFTRSLLEPFSAAMASTLGLQDVQMTSVIGQGFGASATKAFGHNLQATFNESFGYPKRTSLSLEATPNIGTAFRATVYSTSGETLFLSQPTVTAQSNVTNLASLMQLQMDDGSNGLNFAYIRKFP